MVSCEFNSNEIKQLCINQGVRLERSTPYTAEKYGIVERNWRTATPIDVDAQWSNQDLKKYTRRMQKTLQVIFKTFVTIRGSKVHHSKQCMEKIKFRMPKSFWLYSLRSY